MGRPYKNIGPCSEDGCDRPSAAKGLCRTCYGRIWARNKVASDAQAADRKREINRKWASGRPIRDVTVSEKRCGTCKEVKSADEFYRQRQGGDGLQAVCKSCSKLNQEKIGLARRCKIRGITVAQYHALVAQQNGLCGVCKRRPASDLDHCHESNRFRGLLCAACNRILGTVQDDASLLRALADYLDSGGLPVPTP